MASWNETTEGLQLGKCPVCMCSLAKKKLTVHVTKCYENNKVQMEAIGVIKCPLYPLHILPIKYLNHHLEGNCEEAQNLLRKFYQNKDLSKGFSTTAPPTYQEGVPESILNAHNRDLLYLLHQDLYGELIKNQEREDNNDEQ